VEVNQEKALLPQQDIGSGRPVQRSPGIKETGHA